MKLTKAIRGKGQSLWLDHISRDLLERGRLARYIRDLDVTGLTSNPTIFARSIDLGSGYDQAIATDSLRSRSVEETFFELALEDITRAADLFRPVYERSGGVDGWVSIEVSPLLARDATKTIEAAQDLFARAARPNVFIKIPGTPEGLVAVEELIFFGIPINVTLLFSSEHYLGAAEAFLRGIERRIDAGLPADVASVASVFVSRWDTAVARDVPPGFRNKLGIAFAKRTYEVATACLATPRWLRALNHGARPQRIVWASTGTKDPSLPEDFYVRALASPMTVNTMPEATLESLDRYDDCAFLDGEKRRPEVTVADFAELGLELGILAAALQDNGVRSFVESWEDLIESIASKSAFLGSPSVEAVSNAHWGQL